MMKKIFAQWPKDQVPNLGNLLTFRKEVEILMMHTDAGVGVICFPSSVEEENLPSYAYDLLSSGEKNISISFSCTEQTIWPPDHKEIAKWTYGSFKRVGFLEKTICSFPALRWNEKTLEEARQIYTAVFAEKKRKIIAVHLKNVGGGEEESNASMQNWVELFRSNLSVVFVLLGQDPIDSEITSLENVCKLDQKSHSLSVQLAFCSICDGFLGMAAGVSTAAVLSDTPYVIFKHPKHHVAEMQIELGERDHVEFALANQKIVRKIDSYENLQQALEILL